MIKTSINLVLELIAITNKSLDVLQTSVIKPLVLDLVVACSASSSDPGIAAKTLKQTKREQLMGLKNKSVEYS